MNTADILDKAAGLVDQRGLAKRVHVAPDGRVCAGGALRAAAGMIDLNDGSSDLSDGPWNAYIDAYASLEAHLSCGSVAVWNDAPGRTKEEVVSTLRAAAQAARDSDA